MRTPLLVIVALAVAAAVSSAEVVHLEAVADTTVSEGIPHANYGLAEGIRVGSAYDPGAADLGTGVRRGLIRFDLTPLPVAATIAAVTFRAFQSDTSYTGGGVRVFSAWQGWNEQSVTWSDQPEVGDELGLMSMAADQYCSFTSAALVEAARSWLADPSTNHGLAFRFHDELDESHESGHRGDTFRSREHTAATPAVLMVEYAVGHILPGDANLDGEVGLADLTALASNYGIMSGATWRMGDFTGDGKIALADLTALADNYGRRSAPALPAPAAIALLACGAAALLRPRKPGA